MTIWSLLKRGGGWLPVSVALLAALAWVSVPLLRAREARGDVLLAASLFFFPNGLNPVSSMMVIPLVKTSSEILALVAVSWISAGLDVIVGGCGGVYLLIVLTALVLRRTRYLRMRIAPR
jgi:hypothetical protein